MSIYQMMREDWQAYCLIMAIVYIEEMTKPVAYKQIKRYKDRKYDCVCFRSLRLKMRDPEVVNEIFRISKYWQKKKNLAFIGQSFDKVRKENFSGQEMFLFTPVWLNYIIAECGEIPNKYSFDSAMNRFDNFKQYRKIPIQKSKNMFNILFSDNKLAAGAFVVSMDLEFRGIQSGRPSLCMSEKYKDFLGFMLRLAKTHGWTKNQGLSPVSVENSRKLGINASPQFEFRISIKGLREIYSLAGPLANSSKDKCIKFHVERSKNYVNKGYGLLKNNTKGKILNALLNSPSLTSTDLQFVAGVGVDVVLRHLHNLEKEGKVAKKRTGKRYVWSVK